VRELEDFTHDLQSPGYCWEAGLIKLPRIPAGVPYLVGRPIM
jgi:hypothetical protein